MRVELACEAMTEQRRLQLTYDGWSRTVEVHAVGLTKQNRAVMRVWQTRGGGDGKELVGWKLLGLEEILSARICNRRSAAPRPGYNRDDTHMGLIIRQL
jgi:hypothetical protein